MDFQRSIVLKSAKQQFFNYPHSKLVWHFTVYIREFRKHDQDEIIKLWGKCDLIVPWNNPRQDIERKLKVDPDLFLVGELEGNIVATVMGGYEGHRGWINYLAVAPAHRRQGFAKQLVLEIEKRIKEKGCPKINLQVRSSNSEVIAFYKALGFKLDDVIGMGKRLIEDEKF